MQNGELEFPEIEQICATGEIEFADLGESAKTIRSNENKREIEFPGKRAKCTFRISPKSSIGKKQGFGIRWASWRVVATDGVG